MAVAGAMLEDASLECAPLEGAAKGSASQAGADSPLIGAVCPDRATSSLLIWSRWRRSARLPSASLGGLRKRCICCRCNRATLGRTSPRGSAGPRIFAGVLLAARVAISPADRIVAGAGAPRICDLRCRSATARSSYSYPARLLRPSSSTVRLLWVPRVAP